MSRRRRKKFMKGDLIVSDLRGYTNQRILKHHDKMGVILRSAGIGQVEVAFEHGFVLRVLYEDLTLLTEAKNDDT